MALVDDRLRQKAIDDRLYSLDDNTVACRGDHHDWPQLLRRGKLPRGVTAKLERPGVVSVSVTCRGCGRVRSKVTGGRWSYSGGPADFSEPPGYGMTRGQYAGELERRVEETLTAQAQAG